MKNNPDLEYVSTLLQDVFERADMECHYRSKNREHLGNWKNVKTLARRALKELGAEIPKTMQQIDDDWRAAEKERRAT